jgi:hypothetical protein
MTPPSERRGPAPESITRIMLRPVASGLPLGFLAFGTGTILRAQHARRGVGRDRTSIEGDLGHQIEQAESEPGIRRPL